MSRTRKTEDSSAMQWKRHCKNACHKAERRVEIVEFNISYNVERARKEALQKRAKELKKLIKALQSQLNDANAEIAHLNKVISEDHSEYIVQGGYFDLEYTLD